MPLVAIQGIHGCFHEMAARKFFGEDIDILECHTFKILAQSLAEGKCDRAMMAIENTLAGSLLPNYGFIDRFQLHVVGEEYLHIKMNLMARPGTKIKDIRTVMSHPVALAQCEDYLENLENVEVKEYHDTAAAAKWVSESESVTTAAISNDLSARLFGLEILASEIETHKQNFTRFLVLSKEAVQVEDANKASITLKVSHTPGALADVLTIFKNLRLNLTKIQSIPIIGKPYEYAFKIDVTWEDARHFSMALDQIRVMGNEYSIAGIYKGKDYEKK